MAPAARLGRGDGRLTPTQHRRNRRNWPPEAAANLEKSVPAAFRRSRRDGRATWAILRRRLPAPVNRPRSTPAPERRLRHRRRASPRRAAARIRADRMSGRRGTRSFAGFTGKNDCRCRGLCTGLCRFHGKRSRRGKRDTRSVGSTSRIRSPHDREPPARSVDRGRNPAGSDGRRAESKQISAPYVGQTQIRPGVVESFPAG